ncbi:MAG: Gfo/Idh/MocA family oxidoreductase [Armatimonadetes bacterium]|nr:Gfo/Idh/MocA family oxidoreductase [Armatimonadota bacterium]
MDPVRVAVVGIDGIGTSHRRVVYQAPEFELVAAAERYLDRQQQAKAECESWGVPVYGDFWQMIEERDDIEAVIIAAPHHWHATYSIGALEHDLHVMVEKPVTVTVQEAHALLDAQQRAQKLVAVHFQWTSTGATRQTKEFLLDGGLGALKEAVALMLWKRTDEYYQRNEWAGRRYVDGMPCWDGVLMNQAIHLINSALQLSTRQPDFALPRTVQAELYRVHDIETEDLACLRLELDEATLMVYATTCYHEDAPVTVEIIGERGRILWRPSEARVHLNDGTELVFGAEPRGDDTHRNFAACIRGQESSLYAPAEEAVKSTIAANAAYVSAGRIEKLGWEEVTGLADLLRRAAAERKLLSELADAPRWARPGEVVDVSSLHSFDGLADDPPH